ncbi:MAG: hypothetical protein PF505_13145, partial [Vallitaleaceae bacterium]|nr:hypothetical protein [Vallitaleaceae bacterium]
KIVSTKVNTTKESRDKLNKKRQRMMYVVFGSKIALGLIILLFIILMFSTWFTLTGTGSERGIIRIDENMKPNMEKEVLFAKEDTVTSRVVDFSPMSLVKYAIAYKETYKLYTDEEGAEVTSTFARLHLFYIWLFLIVMGGAVMSIALLVIGKDYQFTPIVRAISIMTAGVVVLNYISLKIPFFNMITIRVQSLLNVEYPDQISRITQEGIASGDISYSYGVELLSTFKVAMIALLLWIIISAAMGEIKNKIDDVARMNEPM